MNRRHVDMRISRKPIRLSEGSQNDVVRSRIFNTNVTNRSKLLNQHSKKRKCKPHKYIKNTSIENKIPSVSKIYQIPIKEHALQTTDPIETRRRKADAGNYIKRRFLYEDETPSKHIDTKNHRFRNCRSSAALMAASSANLMHKKQKKNKNDHIVAQTKPLVVSRKSRGRKPKIHPLRQVYQNSNSFSTDDANSETDEQRYSDGSNIPSHTRYFDRNNLGRLSGSDSSDSDNMLKPLFLKSPVARSSFFPNRNFLPGKLHTPTENNFSKFHDLMFDNDLRNNNGNKGVPNLNKTKLQRLVPKPSCNNETNCLQTYTGQQFGNFKSDTPLENRICSTSSSSEHYADSTQQNRNTTQDSLLLQLNENQPLLVSCDTGGVDVNEFAGDLRPQRAAIAPATGSSRRKSPIRPMLVVRTEPLGYQDTNADLNAQYIRPFTMQSFHTQYHPGSSLIQQTQLSLPSSCQISHSNENIEENLRTFDSHHHHTGLGDLCAAAHGELADMHSVTDDYISPSSGASEVSGLVDFSMSLSSQGSIAPIQLSGITSTSQISVVNSNLVSVQTNRLFAESNSSNSHQGLMPTYGLTSSKPPNAKFSQNVYGYTSTKTTLNMSNLKSANSSRRRPTILKRGATGSTNTCQPSRPQISPIISYPSSIMITSPSGKPTISSVNSTSFQPPFMRTIGAFTPGSSGLHKLSITNNTPGEVSLIQTSSQINRNAGNNQLLRLFAPTASNAIAFTTISEPQHTTHTIQTASSRLFGRRSFGSNNRHAASLISNSNICLPPSSSLANQTAPSRPYAVVRAAADGKKYVLLGPPTPVNKQIHQSDDISSEEFQISQDMAGLPMQPEHVVPFPFNSAWTKPTITSPTLSSSVIFASPSQTQLLESTAVS